MKDAHTPEWVHNAVFYQIFPDRFAKSTRVPKPSGIEAWDSPPTRYGYKGGDLFGVAEKLPYLRDLGITALYFNPIFQSASNHRYHTQDYYQVDPLLGGNPAFEALVTAAHALDIRIVLDGVFNHASRGFYQFQQALENGSASPYLDWFHFDRDRLSPGVGPWAYPEPETRADMIDSASGRDDHLPIRDGNAIARYGYDAWWDIPALPKLNTDCEAVREFILDVAEYWIQRGADGWRLDVPEEIDDDEFWRTFRTRVKAANPEAYIVGEIWTEADRWLQGDQFDAVMNYVFNRISYRYFGADCISEEYGSPGGQTLTPMTAADMAVELPALLDRYAPDVTRAQLNLLSSHDEPRFVNVVSGDRAAFRLATAFQLTLPGAPCIYYGDELGMEGGYDPDCRRTFPADETALDHETFEWTKTLIALRREYEALRTGDFRVAIVDRRTFGYVRCTSDTWALVLFNAGRDAWAGDVELEAALGAQVSVARDDTAAGPDRTATDRLQPEARVVFGGDGSTSVPLKNGTLTGLKLEPQSLVIAVGRYR